MKISFWVTTVSLLTSIVLPAQKNTNTRSNPVTTTGQAAGSQPGKYEQKMNEAESYAKFAGEMKGKIKAIFPSQSKDTVYAIIPGISYSDPNLKLLKQDLDGVKATKGITASYRNGMAVVKILFKGDASQLYDKISDKTKELFEPEDMEGARMILKYKHAVMPKSEPTGFQSSPDKAGNHGNNTIKPNHDEKKETDKTESAVKNSTPVEEKRLPLIKTSNDSNAVKIARIETAVAEIKKVQAIKIISLSNQEIKPDWPIALDNQLTASLNKSGKVIRVTQKMKGPGMDLTSYSYFSEDRLIRYEQFNNTLRSSKPQILLHAENGSFLKIEPDRVEIKSLVPGMIAEEEKNLLAIYARLNKDQGQLNKPAAVNKNSKTGQRVATDSKPVIVSSKPSCDPASYLPLCGTMTFTYEQIDALGMETTESIRYKHFTSIKSDGKIFYGYHIEGEGAGTDGNVYYNIENGVITELYEIPDINHEYAGSTEEVINIFKAPTWDNMETVDHYETSLKYNTGRFRAVTLLKANAKKGDSWTDHTIVDNVKAVVSHQVLAEPQANMVINGRTYKNVITLIRKVVSNDVTSLQYLYYAQGKGLVQVQDIDRRHFMSDFVKPNRVLVGSKMTP